MWNVNDLIENDFVNIIEGFILTMWNVNGTVYLACLAVHFVLY